MSAQASVSGAVSKWRLTFAITLAVTILLVLSGCIGKTQHTYAQHPAVSSELDEAISSAIISRNEYYSGGKGECGTEGHIVLGVDGSIDEGDGEAAVYALVDFCEYGFEDGNFVGVAWYQDPAVFTFTRSDDGGLVCTGYIEAPEATAGEGGWVGKTFPAYCSEEAITPSSEDYKDMRSQEIAHAKTYLESIGRDAAIGHYGDFDRTLFSDVGISAKVSNKCTGNHAFDFYPLGLGTREQIEHGVRYVYETTYDKDAHLLMYEKYDYDTGTVVEHIEVDSTMGDIVPS